MPKYVKYHVTESLTGGSDNLHASTTAAAPKQKQCVPFNPELYRRQVDEVFRTVDRNKWGSEGRAAEPLLRIKAIADDFVQQEIYVGLVPRSPRLEPWGVITESTLPC